MYHMAQTLEHHIMYRSLNFASHAYIMVPIFKTPDQHIVWVFWVCWVFVIPLCFGYISGWCVVGWGSVLLILVVNMCVALRVVHVHVSCLCLQCVCSVSESLCLSHMSVCSVTRPSYEGLSWWSINLLHPSCEGGRVKTPLRHSRRSGTPEMRDVDAVMGECVCCGCCCWCVLFSGVHDCVCTVFLACVHAMWGEDLEGRGIVCFRGVGRVEGIW